MFTRILMLAALCLPLSDCCMVTAWAQIKLSESKTQVWDGFENATVVDGKVMASVTSRPKLVDVKTSYLIDKPADYRVQELIIESKPDLSFVDVGIVDISPTQSELKFPVGTQGDFRFTLRLKNDKGEVTTRGNLSVTNKPFEPIEPIIPGDLTPIGKQSRQVMAALVASMAADMDKAAAEIEATRVKTVLELGAFTTPLDVATRNTFKKSMETIIAPRLGVAGLPADAPTVLKEVAAGFRSVK